MLLNMTYLSSTTDHLVVVEEAHCVTYMNEIPQGGNALEPSPPDQPVLEPGQKHRVSQKKKIVMSSGFLFASKLNARFWPVYVVL